MTWQESYDYAFSQGGRLPTLVEGNAIITAKGGPLLTTSYWVAVGDPLNKDWM